MSDPMPDADLTDEQAVEMLRLHASGLWTAQHLAIHYCVSLRWVRFALYGEVSPSPWARYVDAVVEVAGKLRGGLT